MRVEELMTQNPEVCTPDASLNDAARIMWECDCGSLPVVEDASSRRLIAMITDRDIAMAAYTQGKTLHEISIREAMSKGVATCSPDHAVAAAGVAMARAQVRRLPVVDGDNQLLGLLTLAHIARSATDGPATDGRKKAKRTEDSPTATVGETLAAICRPTEGSRAQV